MDYTTLIDAPALLAMAEGSGLVILDCRFDLAQPAAGRNAYLEGHIPTAQYADLERDLSAPPGPGTGRHPLPDPEVLAARFGAWGIDQGTQVIAYDAGNGAFAARFWWLLRWLGHSAVAVLDGGFAAWRAAGGAVQAGEPAARDARRFAVHPQADAWLSTTAVVRLLGDPSHLIVDARAPERYAGSVEPLDPVAGHVPGAVNHPFSANLDAHARFLPAAELHRRWQQRLAGTPPHRVIAMCGSGVTACHNLLALEVAGLSGARLYAGSWSEWIRDAARPVASGMEP